LRITRAPAAPGKKVDRGEVYYPGEVLTRDTAG
jgi:hypothetical protein